MTGQDLSHFLGNGNLDSQIAQIRCEVLLASLEHVSALGLLGVVVSWAPRISRLKVSITFNDRNDGTVAKNCISQQSPGTSIPLALSSSSEKWRKKFSGNSPLGNCGFFGPLLGVQVEEITGWRVKRTWRERDPKFS